MLPRIYQRADTADKLLKRFLHVFGTQLNWLNSFADAFPTIFDVNKCDAKFLPLLAGLVGIEITAGLDTDTLRKLIANAIFIWSEKGTISGVVAHCENLTGWPTTVTVSLYSLPVTNSAVFSTFSYSNVGNPNIVKSWNPSNAQANKTLIITMTTGGAPTAFNQNLLNQTLPLRVPVGVSWVFVYN